MAAVLADLDRIADEQVLLLRKLRYAFGFSTVEARDFVRMFGKDAGLSVDNAEDSHGTHDEEQASA